MAVRLQHTGLYLYRLQLLCLFYTGCELQHNAASVQLKPSNVMALLK